MATGWQAKLPKDTTMAVSNGMSAGAQALSAKGTVVDKPAAGLPLTGPTFQTVEVNGSETMKQQGETELSNIYVHTDLQGLC